MSNNQSFSHCGGTTRRHAIFAVALTVMLSFVGLLASAAETQDVKGAMQFLKGETAKLGTAKLDGEVLYFGSTKINGDFSVVDTVKGKHGGTATLFAKKGNNFVRVSTNVLKDGQRAVGTILDPSGPAFAAVNQGNSFYGMVDILGKIYDTGYEPIKSDAGAIIGVYYVGYLME